METGGVISTDDSEKVCSQKLELHMIRLIEKTVFVEYTILKWKKPLSKQKKSAKSLQNLQYLFQSELTSPQFLGLVHTKHQHNEPFRTKNSSRKTQQSSHGREQMAGCT